MSERPHAISVTLGGHSFSIRADSDFLFCLETVAEATARRAAMVAGRGSDPEETSSFLMRVLDTLLGSGSAALLYGDSIPDPLVVCDDVCQVVNAYHAFRRSYAEWLWGEVN